MIPSLCCCCFSDIGFEVPDAFLVGYALDYNEYFRDLSVSLTPSAVSSLKIYMRMYGYAHFLYNFPITDKDLYFFSRNWQSEFLVPVTHKHLVCISSLYC